MSGEGAQIDAAARRLNRRMLLMAARAAARGAGLAEPNPLVGCVIGKDDGTVLGIGHHRRFGGPHAEVEALANCAANGGSARGATAWVTLEPCTHTGKTGPCTRALIDSGIARVVIARRDPNPISCGGVEALAKAGIKVEVTDCCDEAVRISDPFVKRITTGLPWVICKWAQTIDGRIATRTGESKWISCEASRRLVHRWRGRVDVILTGIGTVLADDPLLTARGVPVRRVAHRVVLDSNLRIPLDCRLVKTAREFPLTVFTTGEGAQREKAKLSVLREGGVTVVEMKNDGARVDVSVVLHRCAKEINATNVMVEAGSALNGALLSRNLVDELRVFVGGIGLWDPGAPGPAVGAGFAGSLGDAKRWSLVRNARCDRDALLVYRRE